MTQCKALINSIYHGSAVDGRGLRSVVFFSGCNLRCPFCHNPESFCEKGKEYDLNSVVQEICRYKAYIRKGGVTLSGGEPFLQAEFCISLAKRLHAHGLEVIAETNGTLKNECLLRELDGVRLDIKRFGGENADALTEKYGAFIELCDKTATNVQLTSVLVPSVNDDARALTELKDFLVRIGRDELELLPFKKMCVSKYTELGLHFPYVDIPEANGSDVERAYALLRK